MSLNVLEMMWFIFTEAAASQTLDCDEQNLKDPQSLSTVHTTQRY